MVWRGDANGHVAASLLTLIDQIDKLAPNRDRSYDGTIGDTAHQARKSDHNIVNGVVHALDITHDPAHGVDAQQIADQIRASRDPRVSYLIHRGRISNPDIQDWAWRERNQGPEDHAHHLHVSVKSNELAESTGAWKIDFTDVSPTPARRPLLKQGASGAAVRELQALLGAAIDGEFGADTLAAVTAFQAAAGLDPDGVVGSMTWAALFEAKRPTKLQTNIKSTVFNDRGLAYLDASPDAPGVALPAVFAGKRPLLWVRNRANGMSAVLEIIDKGPWYDGTPNKPGDAYWETPGKRPRAEDDASTNHAGIDLNVAGADALGVQYTIRDGKVVAGEAQLDWGFLPEGAPLPQPEPVPEPATLAEAIAALNRATIAMSNTTARLEQLIRRAGGSTSTALVPRPQPSPAAPVPSLEHTLPIAADLVSAIIGATPQGAALKGATTALRVLGELAKAGQRGTG